MEYSVKGKKKQGRNVGWETEEWVACASCSTIGKKTTMSIFELLFLSDWNRTLKKGRKDETS
jgi:hypothetical protein